MSNSSRSYRRHGVQVESYDDYAERLRGYGLRGWRWILYAVLAIALAVVCSLIIVPKAAAQVSTTNTFNVYSFRTSTFPQTVGAMTTAAQAQCNASLNCLIVFDPILNGFPTGVMPLQCANCTWIDYRIPGSYTVTPTNVKTMNTIRFADQFAGADCGIKVMAADADLGATAGEIWINQNCGTAQWSAVSLSANHTLRFVQGGTYNIGTITLNSFASLFGTLQSTILSYSGSGNAITTTGGNTIEGVFLTLGASAVEGMRLTGTEVTASKYEVTGGGNSTKLVHIAQFNGTTQSGTVKLLSGRSFNYTGIGLQIDHALDVFLDNLSNYANPTNTTAIGLVIDTGTGGVYAQNSVFVNNAAGGMIIKNSTGGAGAFNQWPNYLWFTNVVVDAANIANTSDGVVFDSTLSTSPIYAAFANSWMVGHGLNGLHISGGQGIFVNAGTKIRSNGTNGVLIDNANAAHIHIADNFITGNNTTNNADAHGVYVSANVPDVNISGNLIANTLDTTGHQKFGVKVSAVVADRLRIVNNNVNPNETGYISNSSTGAYSQCLNDSDVGIAANQCFMSGDLHVHGNFSEDAAIFTSTINAATAYQINGGTMFASGTAPTISTHFNTSGDSIAANGTVAFAITVGNGVATSTAALTLPAATNGWACHLDNQNRAAVIQQTANSTTSATFTNFGTTFAATNWTNGDVLVGHCAAR